MVNRSKQKGTAAETAVVKYLQERGWPNAERRALAGNADKGDIAGLEGVAVEVKDCAKIELAKWVDEANVERRNAGARYGVAWAKRRGKSSPGAWYVVMDGMTFVDLLRALGQ